VNAVINWIYLTMANFEFQSHARVMKIFQCWKSRFLMLKNPKILTEIWRFLSNGMEIEKLPRWSKLYGDNQLSAKIWFKLDQAYSL